MSKPIIVMVPGAWYKPLIYSKVAQSLEKHGYPTVSLALPSAGAKPSHQDFNGDVNSIRECLTELVSAGKEVVLVVHSYTGLPGGEAPKGLSKKDQEAKGLKGGLIRYMKLDTENEVFTVEPEDAKRIFYSDISYEKTDKLIPELLPQSLGVYFSTATYAAWLDVPSTFLYGEADQSSFTPEVVEMMIKGAQMMNPTAFDVVESLKEGGHCFMISHPEWTAEALRRAAGEKF
ncbi:hypothetical protein BELL_0049g00050 [Botrytis elliptica]|uniref:AB hydrolase-1 domain-containing protein n=1 Tax=Botrytis elliptica TaxID=278938 RepID=A0A4Z1KCJ1_9HELO|nr:hypothetical protein EAE99_004209 [Botrytis elliptica]TGO78923.1 hypothetical protein BELL_0049g00050 [Botrytis elliptica]